MINHGPIEIGKKKKKGFLIVDSYLFLVFVDESAMTGESLPVTLHERELAKMGGTVARGEATATVVYTGKDTFFGKVTPSRTSRSKLFA